MPVVDDYTNINSLKRLMAKHLILPEFTGPFAAGVNAVMCFSDAIWRQTFRSKLVQIMACRLMAPSHHRNQCFLIVYQVRNNEPYIIHFIHIWNIFIQQKVLEVCEVEFANCTCDKPLGTTISTFFDSIKFHRPWRWFAIYGRSNTHLYQWKFPSN